MSTIEATSIDTIFVEKNVPISKRSKAGKKAHELLELDEYSAVVGHVANGWEGDQRILLTAKNFDDAVDAVVTYIAEANPLISDYRNKPERFFVLSRGLWSVDEQEFTFVEGVGLFYNEEEGKVERIEFPIQPLFRIDWEFRCNAIDSSILSPVKTALSRLASHREAVERALIRQEKIDALKANYFKEYSVDKAQEFIAKYSAEFSLTGRYDDDANILRKKAVASLVKGLCEHFLNVVGKTTYEVQSIANGGWRRHEEEYQHRVIEVDEAVAHAVAGMARSWWSDDARRDLFGHAVHQFLTDIIR